MIERNTLFVLGAGASKPYGFPTSIGLKNDIIKNSDQYYWKLNTDYPNKFMQYQRTEHSNKLKMFAMQFQDSKTTSIDLFLNTNKDLAVTGKEAIVLSLNIFEENLTEKIMKDVTHYNWLDYLYNNFLIDGIQEIGDAKKFLTNKISFITFNYDRSLEHFLWTALRNYFRKLGLDDLMELFSAIKIYHVYGDLGSYKDVIEEENDSNPLGGIKKVSQLTKISKNIKTIYEREKLDSEKEIENMFREAKHGYFMGFGFAPENVNALKLDKIEWENKLVFSTAVDLISREKSRIIDRLPKDLRKIKFPKEEMDCLELLKNQL